MKVQDYTETPAETYGEIEGVSIRWVISQKDGAPNFAMRVIEVAAGHHTPYHSHTFEHEVYVLAGTGMVRGPDGVEKPLSPGTVVYVPPDEEHGFFNRGSEALRFICVIPHPA